MSWIYLPSTVCNFSEIVAISSEYIYYIYNVGLNIYCNTAIVIFSHWYIYSCVCFYVPIP